MLELTIIGKSLQIIAALTATIGGIFFWNWYKFEDGAFKVSQERYQQTRCIMIISAILLALGFILELISIIR
jgi:hypothetical protein